MKQGVFAGLAALMVIVAAPAGAQVSNQGGPVQVGADQMHSDQNTRTMYLDGRVEMIQDNARLRADHAQILYAEGGGDVQHMEASGNIYYVTTDTQGQQTIIKGDNAVYNKSDDTMVVTGDVILQQGQSVMTGNRLTSQVQKGITTLDANPTQTGKGRVKAVLYPTKDGKSTAPAPAAH